MIDPKTGERHCMRDPSVIGCCAGPGQCSCECNTCLCPLCMVNPCECPPYIDDGESPILARTVGEAIRRSAR
jgi:hypothetical protein